MSEQTQDQVNRTLQLYAGLTANIQTKTSPDTPLLLAHYTSVEVVEKILKHEDLWFSNPLYMNDLEEMRLGIFVGGQLFPKFAQAASRDADHSRRLVECFNHFMAHLDAETALDTYVFCLSEHDYNNVDGLLSMWREYGSKGKFALTTKHRGFSEEREWRAIYVPERDPLGYLRGHLDYAVGSRGVEPKLKFKFGE